MLRTGVAAAIFWMCMAALLNSVAGGMVRAPSGEIPIIELVFFRNVVALVILAPWVKRHGIVRLLSALLSAGSNTVIKLLSRSESPEVITVWTNLLMMPLAFVPMLFVWVLPSWPQVPWVLGIGIASSIGGYSFTRAVASADARIVQPFQFSRMIFATAIRFLMFAELPDIWTWIGAVVIFAASYYVVLRERKGAPVPGDREHGA